VTGNYPRVLLARSQEEQENAQVPMINSQRVKRGGLSRSFKCLFLCCELIVPSYVASLESRVEKLERKIAYARSRKASVAMHDADEPIQAPDRKDSLATIRAAIHGKAARRREAADVNELVSDFGFL
jgi:hypothetical protein